MNVTTKATGDWNNKAIWSNNAIPAASDNITILADNVVTIPANYTVTVASGATITINPDTQLDVAGTLNNGGAISTQSGIVVSQGGTLNNTGSIAGPAFIQNSGNVTNAPTGTMTNQTYMGEMNNSFMNESAGTVSNQGIITNNSGLSNAGAFTNSGTITSAGTITNSGTMNNSGTITINSPGGMTNPGTLNNTGTLNLNGLNDLIFTGVSTNGAQNQPQIDGQFSSYGTFTQGAGSVIALGSGTQASLSAGTNGFVVPAKASLVVGTGTTFTINANGTLYNDGTITSSGGISSTYGITNNGTINNNGTITLSGTVPLSNGSTGTFNNSGTLNVNVTGGVQVGGNFLPGGGEPNNPPTMYGAIHSEGTWVFNPGSSVVLGSGTQVALGIQGGACWFSVPAGTTLVVNGGATLSLEDAVILYNYGTINNQAALQIFIQPLGKNRLPLGPAMREGGPGGSIVNGGEIQNYGLLNNGQNPTTYGYGQDLQQATLNNAEGGLVNETTGTVYNYGTLNNAGGTIDNNGVFHKSSGNITGGGNITGSNPLVP